MRTVLVIFTSKDQALPRELARCGHEPEACRVRTIDLTAPEPDYDGLLDEIFAADSIAVW